MSNCCLLMGHWWKNYKIKPSHWTKNILLLYGEVFGSLNILRPYAVENIVIPTSKYCRSEFHGTNQHKFDVKYVSFMIYRNAQFIYLDRFGHPEGHILLHRSLVFISIILRLCTVVVKDFIIQKM